SRTLLGLATGRSPRAGLRRPGGAGFQPDLGGFRGDRLFQVRGWLQRGCPTTPSPSRRHEIRTSPPDRSPSVPYRVRTIHADDRTGSASLLTRRGGARTVEAAAQRKGGAA